MSSRTQNAARLIVPSTLRAQRGVGQDGIEIVLADARPDGTRGDSRDSDNPACGSPPGRAAPGGESICLQLKVLFSSLDSICAPRFLPRACAVKSNPKCRAIPNRLSAATPHRPLSLYEILAIVLLWNAGYKGARVVNTLYALELGAAARSIPGCCSPPTGVFPLLLAVFIGKIADRYGVRVPVIAGTIVSVLGTALPWVFPVAADAVRLRRRDRRGLHTDPGLDAVAGRLARQRGGSHPQPQPLRAGRVHFRSSGPDHRRLFDRPYRPRPHLRWSSPRQASWPSWSCSSCSIAWRTRAGGSDRSGQRMVDLLRIGHLRRMFLTSALVMTGLDLFQLYLPLHGHSIGLSASAIGMMLGAFAAAGIRHAGAAAGAGAPFRERSARCATRCISPPARSS